MKNTEFKNLASDYAALFLDNDGTTVLSEKYHGLARFQILNDAGIQKTLEECNNMLGLGEAAVYRKLTAEGYYFPYDVHAFKDMHSTRYRSLLSHASAGDLIRPGMKRLINAFKKAQKPVVVVSNGDFQDVHLALTRSELLPKIDRIIAANHPETRGLMPKPCPDYYVKAWIENMSQSQCKALVVEDSQTGVMSAFAAVARNLAHLDVWQIYYDRAGQLPDQRAVFISKDSQHMMDVQRNANRDPLYRVGDFDERPWGRYRVTDVQYQDGQEICKKTISVKPSKALSLQSHNLRDEVWRVCSGSLRVVLDNQVMDLKSGEEVVIPKKALHAMVNVTQQQVIVEEVQTGICKESDIIRYSDTNGRIPDVSITEDIAGSIAAYHRAVHTLSVGM